MDIAYQDDTDDAPLSRSGREEAGASESAQKYPRAHPRVVGGQFRSLVGCLFVCVLGFLGTDSVSSPGPNARLDTTVNTHRQNSARQHN